MKIFIFLLIAVLNFELFSQSNLKDPFENTYGFDTVDFNRFDTALFVNCFINLCNQERLDINGKSLKLSVDGMLAAQFHSDYNSETGILEHAQTQSFQGLTLKTPESRLKHFSKGKNLTFFGEIISKSSFCTPLTYQFLAKKIFRMYFMSEGHRKVILSNLNKNINISSGINISKENGSIIFHTCFVFFE